MRTADLLAGLSRLADLGFGFHAGESLRSGVLAAGFAHALDLPAADVRAAMYTALLHHIGCTGYAHETAARYTDEFALNAAASRFDFTTRDMFATFLPMLTHGRPPLERVRLMVGEFTGGKRFGQDYTTATCEVGRDTARRLGLPDTVQRAVYHVYEVWHGGGDPSGLAKDAIPLAARIARLTGVAALFDTLGGADLAVDAVRRRGGFMLDPDLAAQFTTRAHDLLRALNAGDPADLLLAAEPEPVATVPPWELPTVAAAFGDLADLKAPHLHGHSRAVATLAKDAGPLVGLSPPVVRDLEIAALLHDIGRVAISSTVWEKPGKLTAGEWEQVRLHAYHSERILAGSPALTPLAQIAGRHHERLDGSGYHRGCAGAEIGMPARVLAAADAYQAMTQPRPHRPALNPGDAERELERDAHAGRLDADAVAAVLAAAGRPIAVMRKERPAGLSDREVEVLGLLARGGSNAQIAERLVISRRTAEHHVQHIYTKIGVSSRAAAALFAMEHDLLRDG